MRAYHQAGVVRLQMKYSTEPYSAEMKPINHHFYVVEQLQCYYDRRYPKKLAVKTEVG